MSAPPSLSGGGSEFQPGVDYAAHRDEASEAASQRVRLYREAVNHWLLVALRGIHTVEGANAGDAAFEMARDHSLELERRRQLERDG